MYINIYIYPVYYVKGLQLTSTLRSSSVGKDRVTRMYMSSHVWYDKGVRINTPRNLQRCIVSPNIILINICAYIHERIFHAELAH